MSKFIDTTGRTKIAIGICGRCGLKFPYDDLIQDPNYPGLYVCQDDVDNLDPWRLPARETENISLDHPRPDAPVTDFQDTALYGNNQINPIDVNGPVLNTPLTALGPRKTWQPNTYYEIGDTITPQNVDDSDVPLPQVWLVCIRSGYSGSTPPTFPPKSGVILKETL